jgi:hypothetical protein
MIRYGQKKQEFRTDMDPMQTAHGMIGAYIGLLVHQNLFRASVTYDPVLSALETLLVTGIQPLKA